MARTKKSSNVSTGRQSVQPPKKITEVEQVEKAENVKSNVASTGKLIQKKKTKRTEKFSHYIYKVLKQVHPEMTISGRAMKVMDEMVNDVFERLANEAGTLAKQNKRPTLTARDVQFATRFLLPGGLAEHAHNDGAKAVAKYEASKSTAEDGASSNEDDDEESEREDE